MLSIMGTPQGFTQLKTFFLNFLCAQYKLLLYFIIIIIFIYFNYLRYI